MFQHFHRRAKIKFARKRRASPGTSHKRRVTIPTEDSLLGRLFNDVGIHALVEEIRWNNKLVRKGKNFVISLKGLMNSPKGAQAIYKRARFLWEYEVCVTTACTYAIDEVPSFSNTLVSHSNHDTPDQQMSSMMKDPWLDYILGLRQSDALIRGFLSILIGYWNMKDIIDKKKLGEYGQIKEPITSESDSDDECEEITYAIDHVEDFHNLREVLESKYGSDPDLVARLFEEISDFQLHGMDLANMWTGDRAMIDISLWCDGSRPPRLCKSVFSFYVSSPGKECSTITWRINS